MRHVLNREVRASDGVTYPVGTPLEQLPREHHESLIQTRWTTMAPDKPKPKPEPKPAPVVEDEPVVEDADDQAPEPEVDEPAEAPADEPEQELDDSPSLHTLPISDELKELLAEAMLDDMPLTTVADVIAFGERNKGFRVIKGIGKVGNDEIQEALAAL